MVMIDSWQIVTQCLETDAYACHIHDCCELLYVYDGQLEIQVRGACYVLTPNQLAIISHLEVHSVTPLEFPYARIGFHIAEDSLARLGIPPWLSCALTHRQTAPFHKTDLTGQEEIVQLIHMLHKENHAAFPAREDMQGVLVHALLLLLYRTQPQNFQYICADTQMEEARVYIEEHFAENYSVEALARRYYLSESHFIVRFKEHTGYTPQKYRKLCRMAHARYLLVEGNWSLSVIAENCGFSDLNGFVRSFRETMQMTPGQFREKFRGKKEMEL